MCRARLGLGHSKGSARSARRASALASLTLAGLGSLATLGCGRGASSQSPANDLPTLEADYEPYGDLARFLPLRDYTVFAYATQNEESGETGLLVIQIRHRSNGLVERTIGAKKEWLEPTPAAVKHSSGGSVLRMHLTPGSSWKGPSGVVELRAVGRRVDVPAGSFSECIETEENSAMGDSSERVITSYCPDVGVTRLELESTVSNSYRHEVAELSSWGPMLDWGEDGTEVTK